MVFKLEICEFENGKNVEQIYNHCPNAVAANIHINEIELVKKNLAGKQS